MKTKNILKAMAAAMLMPAMMLTTACSSDDDLANSTPDNIIHKGYEVPVTVSVTRQGDADATGNRASFNESTKKLEFTTGDKLFVKGSQTTAGNFAGTLDYDAVSGKFCGTITTEKEYTGSIDALLESSAATLLPKGYESYEFLSVPGSGYNADLFVTPAKAFATTKAAAVEQFSQESGLYTSGTGFALEPIKAVLNFTIAGLAASTGVTVVFNDSSDDISGNVTTDASGTATFAIGVRVGKDLKDCTLKVDGTAITLVNSSKTVAAGKIYNISRIAGVEAVDLGLSVKWANMNVGATSVTDYGKYYAWGATTDNYSAGNDYDWAHTPYYTGDGSAHSWSEYASAPATLDVATDDAARANWGGSWRMPTETEFQELLDNTTRTWQTDYQGVSGCNGYLFTSTKSGYTDKSIFLPAAGDRYGSLLGGDGSLGYYWSSTLISGYVNLGRGLYFNSGDAGVYYYNRCNGFTVRAVQ